MASVITPRFSMVLQEHPLWPSMQPLRSAVVEAAPGDCVAFAVPLNTPVWSRLLTLSTLRWQRRRAVRAIQTSGGDVIAHVGVDPSLERASCLYELNSAAASYADRRMRPRGSAMALRRFAERCFGCDPALGGVMVVGKKRCL